MPSIFKKQKGFTVIELIISIFILSAAIIGILSAFSIMNILTSDTADRLTATYLAQEGMEIVRNIRDTNWLNTDTCVAGGVVSDGCPSSWVDGLTINGVNSLGNPDCRNGCEADYTTDTSVSGSWAMSPWSGRYLYINNNGFYVYNQNAVSKTKFQRKIIIVPTTDIDGISDKYHILKVKVQVSWDTNANILYPKLPASSCNSSNCVTAEETLYDWYNFAQ